MKTAALHPILASRLRCWGPRLCAGVLATAALIGARAACVDEDNVETRVDQGSQGEIYSAASARGNLLQMVQRAIERSQAIGATRLLAEAAAIDVDEIRSSRWPQVSVNGFIGGVSSEVAGVDQGAGKQGRVGFSVSMPLLDGGRTSDLTDWRTHLAEAARLGQVSAQEQVALQTVSMSIERSRYRLQVRVYQQYTRKMSCMVEALETIVRSDRGRASELVQAQKSQKQAEMSLVQSESVVRQIEARLKRLVGDDLPPTDGLAPALLDLPELPVLLSQVDNAPDLAAMLSQANAAQAYARSVRSGRWPQVSFVASGTQVRGMGNSASLSAGLNVSMPILNLPIGHAIDASDKRAEAARLQRAEALDARKYRMVEVHEQGLIAFDRARRVVAVLRDSDRVRNFTLQQWQQLGKRSLFDVMGAEGEHYGLRVAYVNALYDAQQSTVLLWSLGQGVTSYLR